LKPWFETKVLSGQLKTEFGLSLVSNQSLKPKRKIKWFGLKPKLNS